MSINKFVRLFEMLEELTGSGKLEWESTEHKDTFQVPFPEYTIRLTKRPPQEEGGGWDYFIQLFNHSGELLEEIADFQLRNIVLDIYPRLAALYNQARGYALGIEQSLDSIIAELEKKLPPSTPS